MFIRLLTVNFNMNSNQMYKLLTFSSLRVYWIDLFIRAPNCVELAIAQLVERRTVVVSMSVILRSAVQLRLARFLFFSHILFISNI